MFLTYYQVKKKSSINWSKSVLSQLIFAILNYGCIPVLGTLLTAFRCENGIVIYSEGIICWSHSHILLFVFSILAIILYAPLLTVSALLYFDAVRTKKVYTSIRETNNVSLEIVWRVILTTMFVLLPNYKSKPWVISITSLFVYCYLLYDSIANKKIFHMMLSDLVICIDI